MSITVALAGDTMLGRGVADVLAGSPPDSLVAPEVVATVREADLFVLNLECCISDRGAPWPEPGKPFFFRAPPRAVETLTHLGVSCVTLANNHALDYGEPALLDTLDHLASAAIRCVGAGRDVHEARTPAVLEARGFRLAVVGLTDHPVSFAAGEEKPGVALTDLRTELPGWVGEAIARVDADAVLVTPHWGPNMVAEPVPHVRRAAEELTSAGATLVAGHSAHVFHGVAGRVLYDLGDFLDDYAVDPVLRNDLGLLFLVTLDESGPRRIEALPLKLDYCHTLPAGDDDARWITRRFEGACAELGSEVTSRDGRLIVDLKPSGVSPPQPKRRS